MNALVLGPTGMLGDAMAPPRTDRYIHPSFGRERPYWGDTVMRPLMPFRAALSRWITDSQEVARAVLHAATGGRVPSPAGNRDIIAAAAAYAETQTERTDR